MTNRYTVSFIIIVYNTEIDLLRRCINSVVKNASLNSEIIIIDDGSTVTEIRELCTEYSTQGVKYIYKKNGGSGSARNEGVKNAQGKYIFFIDSDDYLNEDIFNKIQLDSHNEDIIFLDYYIKKGNDLKRHSLSDNYYDNYDKFLQILFRCLLGDYGLLHGYTAGAIWNKLFKRDFLIKNNLFFDTNVPKGQDVLFVIKCLLKKPKTIYINESIYVYYINKNSICHKPNQNLISYYDIFLKVLKSLTKEVV